MTKVYKQSGLYQPYQVELGHGLRLWQRRDALGVTSDTLALADFVGYRPGCRRIGDLGSGGGGLTLLLWAHNPAAACVGLEIRPELVELAQRSLALNCGACRELGEHCRFLLGDWRQPERYFPADSFDLLVSNPPFWPKGAGRLSPLPLRAAACHELNGGLRELMGAAGFWLKKGGRLALILPLSREREAVTQDSWRLERRAPAAGGRVLLELEKI